MFQDFLKDIGEKEEQYYSQKPSNDVESPECEKASAKRRKLASAIDFDDLDDIAFDDVPDFARNSAKSPPTTQQKFQKVSPKLAVQSPRESSGNKSPASFIKPAAPEPSPQQTISIAESRKNLALQILLKGSAENNPPPRLCVTDEEARRRRLVAAFKKPSVAKILHRISPKDSPRLTLVRKFPGPAGLLPDNPDAIDDSKLLDGITDPDIAEELRDSNISEYCSQNTERLFSVGAWRTMLDDLPTDFLQCNDIATAKRLARNKSSRETPRVPYLAGVIQKMDNSAENPCLVLKDASDTIEATMHKDLPLAHPNVFEPGVVLLLRNVGVLGILGSQVFRGFQYHLMIAPRSVLAVYNEKTRLVTSPVLKTILGNDYKEHQLQESQESSPGIRDSKVDEKRILTARNPESNDEDNREFACFDVGEIKDSEFAKSFAKASTRTPPFLKKRAKDGKRSAELSEKPVESMEVDARPKKMSMKAKLSEFRSKDVLTPPEPQATATVPTTLSVTNAIGNEDEMTTTSGTFGDDLMDDDDTDDELLSQLDVDSIVSNYGS